jgi:prephenate dehydrogenase
MIRFNRVTIIGVGLIGGSIGLAIRKRRIADEIIGVFRRASTMRKALKKGAVDLGTRNIKEGVKDADLIIIASPVMSVPKLAVEAARHSKPGAIITDVGSTKNWIVGIIEDSLGAGSPARFVGSHPMAGSEKAGVEFAKNDLLKGAPCIVTRTSNTDIAAFKKIVKFWKALGARVREMSPMEHDRVVSMISHLPHIVAFSLAGSASSGEIACAAEGFWDTTRVASSDPELWSDIFLTNPKEIIDAYAVFNKRSKMIIDAIRHNRRKDLVRCLTQAKSNRDKFIDYR